MGKTVFATGDKDDEANKENGAKPIKGRD